MLHIATLPSVAPSHALRHHTLLPAGLPSIAPESHGAVRSVEMRQRMFNGQGSDQSLKVS